MASVNTHWLSSDLSEIVALVGLHQTEIANTAEEVLPPASCLVAAVHDCWVDFSIMSPQDFVSTIIRLLDSPSTAIRAKAFLVLLYILIYNRDMLLLSCQARYGAPPRESVGLLICGLCLGDDLLAFMYLLLKAFSKVYKDFDLSLCSLSL